MFPDGDDGTLRLDREARYDGRKNAVKEAAL
jgi:hypothetical protein